MTTPRFMRADELLTLPDDDEYLEAGARLVWVVNPRRRTMAVHAPGRASTVLEESETLDGGEVLSGLRALVRDVMG